MATATDSTTISAAVLGSALGIVAPASKGAGGFAGLVLLGGGRLEAMRPGLRVTVSIPEIDDLPACIVPIGRFTAIVREVSGDVKLSPDGERLGIRGGKGGKWMLAVRQGNEWPEAAASKSTPVFRMPADQLARCIEGTIDAVDPAAGATALQGIRIDVTDGKIVFCATDGRRLHICEAEVDQAVDDCAITVPATTLRVVLQLCREDGDAAVQLLRTHSEAIFECGSTVVTAGLLEGNFPKWQRVLREPNQGTTVQAAELLAAVRQAAVVTSEVSRGVAVRITGARGAIAAKTAEYGTSTVAFRPASTGCDAWVVVDPKYLASWLGTVDPAGIVDIDLGDGATSVVLRHDSSTAIVMPLETAKSSFEFADV